MGKKYLGVITLPITIGEATLQIPIHVMPHDLSYNPLLGRPWIHEMNAMPSTLDHIMKYVYNNHIYEIEIDPKPKSCLHLEKGATSPLKILIPTSKIDPLEIKHNDGEFPSKLFGDDWGSLEFTPSFMGE